MTLTQIQTALIALVQGIFGVALKQVDSLPAKLDSHSIKRILSSTPGVFIVCMGGRAKPEGMTVANALCRWVFIAATGHAGEEVRRRIGDPTSMGAKAQIGAYDIIGQLTATMHGKTIAGCGTLQFAGFSTLFDDATDLEGVTTYGVDFDLPMDFDPNDYGGVSSLGDFLHYNDTVTLPTLGDGHAPPTNDDVELPGA